MLSPFSRRPSEVVYTVIPKRFIKPNPATVLVAAGDDTRVVAKTRCLIVTEEA